MLLIIITLQINIWKIIKNTGGQREGEVSLREGGTSLREGVTE